jgi:Peptidase family M28
LIHLALALLAAAAPVGTTRTFWKPVSGPSFQPGQTQVTARLEAEGEHILVYREQGFSFSTLGADDEARQIADLVRTFDTVIYPRETDLYGPCPDHDGNGKVIVLICDLTDVSGMFFWFDEMSEDEAVRYGFHSNQGEVLYDRFEQQGNRAPWNLRSVAATFHQLLHAAGDPRETWWSRIIADYEPFRCGLTTPRWLWGDASPSGHLHRPSDPLADGGWSPLFVEYLKEQFGDDILRDLVRDQGHGLSSLTAILAKRGAQRTGLDALADFAMACWLDDPGVANGRFSFTSVAPRRPLPAVRVPASRPGAGYVTVGAGGMTHIVVEGIDEHRLPLTLQGDRAARWIGRAVLLRRDGPDSEVPLVFDDQGVARLDIPDLGPESTAVLAVVPEPAASDLFDARTLTLQWGLGWVPRPQDHPVGERYAKLLKAALPDGGDAARTRIERTLDRLTGMSAEPGAPKLVTRYAWAPQASAVVSLLEDETRARGLENVRQPFTVNGPDGVRQEWTNLLIHVPGNDARRWPVVVAAHWDGARPYLADAYERALNRDDDATGVAVALEVAAAVSRARHRAPVLVALLDGGFHDAAGARALLEYLHGQVAVWIELDGVGTGSAEHEGLDVQLDSGEHSGQVAGILARSLRDVGLRPVRQEDAASPHTGLAFASTRGIAAVVMRTRDAEAVDADLGLPRVIERQSVSPELTVLITKALADAAVQLAGAS